MDKEFRIIKDAYPYIASRLLTDPSEELQAALLQLLFKNGQPRWERLQELLEVASQEDDYDAAAAAEQMVSYLVSDRARPVRDVLSKQLLQVVDQLGVEALDYSVTLLSTVSPVPVMTQLGPDVLQGKVRSVPDLIDQLAKSPSIAGVKPGSSLESAVKTASLVLGGRNLNTDKLNTLLKKVSWSTILLLHIF